MKLKLGELRGRDGTYLGSLDELLLTLAYVLLLTLPCREHGGLQGTPVTEAQRPGFTSLGVVDGIEVNRRLLLGLSTRQESDSYKRVTKLQRTPKHRELFARE